MIDLRSDTVTRPTPSMRAAMAAAEVGDDIYGEDPTARALEERVAELLGHEAALFVPSGTMGNQIALALHCRPGDEVVVGEHSHTQLYESGGAAAIAGVQLRVAGRGGFFDVAALDATVNPTAAYYTPRTRLIALENTHNRGGGAVWPQLELEAVTARARQLSLATHLDGARLWNAAAASERPEAELASPFDTVSVCFSKGLGAPVGSALVGSGDAIVEARRIRKMLGGGMRQVGILAAGALHALEHHRERLNDDHANARRLALGMADHVRVDLDAVQTNIVNLEMPRADEFVAHAAEAGVLLNAMSPTTARAVTHMDVDAGAIERALVTLRAIAEARSPSPAP